MIQEAVHGPSRRRSGEHTSVNHINHINHINHMTAEAVRHIGSFKDTDTNKETHKDINGRGLDDQGVAEFLILLFKRLGKKLRGRHLMELLPFVRRGMALSCATKWKYAWEVGVP